MAMLLEASQPLSPALLEKTVQHLLAHHDALRLRFVRNESSWQQSIAAPDDAAPFVKIDLSLFSENEQKAALKTKAAELQTSLDLSKGPLLRVALFNGGRRLMYC
jgi:hypothetical protein